MNRWRYLYLEGEPKYWENRMKQHNSTVIRTNMPPGWPWTDSRCIMFLDQKSYPTVFDSEKVWYSIMQGVKAVRKVDVE